MALEDFHNDITGCSRCSFCKSMPLERITSHRFSSTCPSITRYNFHAYSGGGKLNVALAMLEGRIEYNDSLLDIIYRCAMCGACDTSCKYSRDMEVLEPLYELRVKCVEDGQLVPAHMLIIESLRKQDNTLQGLKSDRGKWAAGLDLKDITSETAEVVYHAGCRFCFDKELWPAARSAINLLKKAGIDVGIAGKDEVCCGGRAYELGYVGELTKYAEHNFDLFNRAGSKILVTSCSDCYYAFKVIYDKLNKKLNLEVLHITEYLDRLVKEGKLTLKNEVPLKVTYHDPCHLGRLADPYVHWQGNTVPGFLKLHNPPKVYRRGTFGVYEPPRNLLRKIPGLKFVEMERIKEYSWCCGAGGGVKEAYPEFAISTALERIEEVKASGVEALVSACGWCERNFNDAIKESGDKIRVYDIVELLEQAIS